MQKTLQTCREKTLVDQWAILRWCDMQADARHLMYAVHNNCNRFVTTDNDFLSRRDELATLCRDTKIVRPSELAAEL